MIPRPLVRLLGLAVLGPFAVAAAAQVAAGDKPYRAELERVYGLEKGQLVKHVPRPFIPERMEWYRAENRTQAEAIPRGPDYLAFDWDENEKLRLRGMGFGFERFPLRNVLGSVIGLRSYEVEGPDDLLSLDFAGDWVVRREADTGEKLAALARMVKQAHGRDVRFVKRDLPREVIVAGGTWKFTPLKGTYDEKQVHLFVDTQDEDEGAGGGSGDLAEFLRMLGDRVGSVVIDEVEGERPATFGWGHHRSSRLRGMNPGPERLEKLVKLLDVVSKQTGLTLEPARRNVPVWVLTEVKPEA